MDQSISPEEALARYLPRHGRLDESLRRGGFLTFRAEQRGAQVSQIEQDNGDLLCLGSSRDPMNCLALKVHGNGRPDIHCNGGQPQLLSIGRNSCQWTAAPAPVRWPWWRSAPPWAVYRSGFLLARYLTAGQLNLAFAEGTCWSSHASGPQPGHRRRWQFRLTVKLSWAVIHWIATTRP